MKIEPNCCPHNSCWFQIIAKCREKKGGERGLTIHILFFFREEGGGGRRELPSYFHLLGH